MKLATQGKTKGQEWFSPLPALWVGSGQCKVTVNFSVVSLSSREALPR
jgi:hypothetical protein